MRGYILETDQSGVGIFTCASASATLRAARSASAFVRSASTFLRATRSLQQQNQSREGKKKNTLPLEAGGRGASTTMSSWGLGPRGHAVVLPRQSKFWLEGRENTPATQTNRA
eukprot:1183449-Prorocentrum_minimum.AAC.2